MIIKHETRVATLGGDTFTCENTGFAPGPCVHCKKPIDKGTPFMKVGSIAAEANGHALISWYEFHDACTQPFMDYLSGRKKEIEDIHE